jgi:NTE family protein
MPDKFPSDAVFEGGGVRGIGLLGALAVMERTWRWENVAGTSAGAIVAAFTAAGMNALEVRKVLDAIDLRELQDEAWEEKVDRVLAVPSVINLVSQGGVSFLRSHLFSLFKDFGVYEGERFIELLEEHLPAGIRTFGDVRYHGPDADDPRYRYRLRVIASDITARRMLVLPQDIEYFGLDPDKLRIAEALRMSMSLPIFFEPYKLEDKQGKTHHIVDGGILSNYPIWLFDAPEGTDPAWPTFGFNMMEATDEGDGLGPFPENVMEIRTLPAFAMAIWNTLFSALDKRYISKRHWARTLGIDDTGVKTTDFDITSERKDGLWRSGEGTAVKFMTDWGDPHAGFAAWKLAYRGEVVEAQRMAQSRGMKLA